jgi:deoxyribose-phosphate aldolase
MSAELARRLVAHLDLTDLRPGLDDAAIERLVERGASSYGPVAGLCVHPSNVASLRAAIDRSALPSRLVAIAGFPDGSGDPDATLDELRQAGDDGADEIDLLYPYAAAMRGDHTGLELVARAAAATGFLKVILESSAWSDPERLVATARDVLAAGASMLKTGSGAAHIAPVRCDDVELLAEVAAETATGGLKVSGGVDRAIAIHALATAQHRFGAEVTAARFRIGASRLLDELEGQATQGEGY